MKRYLNILILSTLCNIVSQITGELQLANEYYKSGEYLKAKILYEELLKDKSKSDFIYDNYINTLEKLNELDIAEKFVKKVIKKYDNDPKYKIDHCNILKKLNRLDEYNKLRFKYIDKIVKDRASVEASYRLLEDRGDFKFIIELLNKAREANNEPLAFSENLANAYKSIGDREKMISEMINMVKYNVQDKELLKNKLQPLLDNDDDLEILQKYLLSIIQKNQEDDNALELFIWVLIQKKDFNFALVQSKALDMRKGLGGGQILQLAYIAFENRDYSTVINASNYLKESYPNTETYFLSLMLALKSKEEQLKLEYPIDINKAKELLENYSEVCKKNAASPQCIESICNQANIYAFYLNNTDTAIKILEPYTKSFVYDRNSVDKAKIFLGDFYLLKGEFWESILLYTQVEKSQKENPLGHEAKLKNAKVLYYKGEFDLAEEQLNILKQATSREIANDALYLSLIIHMNKSEDSAQNALNVFADADMLKFSNKLEQSEKNYQKIIDEFPNDPLVDDALWNLAQIAIKKRQFSQAILLLDKIIEKYYTDIYADDAIYTKANIYEQRLKSPDKAMEQYQKLITEYPASIFVPECRKRFRILRGDKL